MSYCSSSVCRALVASSVASSSRRTLCSSAVVNAAAKSKSAKTPIKKKAQGANFSKGKTAPNRAVGGRGDVLASVRSDLIQDAPDLSYMKRMYPDFVTRANVGRATLMPDASHRAMQAFGLPARLAREAPKSGPALSVIRRATVDLVDKIDQSGKSGSPSRLVLTGARGNGKSTLLFQAAHYCLGQDWIVCYVPKAQDWINSSSPYEYNAERKRFEQPAIASALLSSMLAANPAAFKALDLTSTVERGAKDLLTSVKVLDQVFSTLANQTQFPVLLAVDDVQALYQRSEYRSTDNTPLESYHLSTPSLALDFFAGRQSFKRGLVLGALSTSNPTLKPSPSLLKSLQLPTPAPTTPYDLVEPTHEANAAGLTAFKVPTALVPKEAQGMYEIWAGRGWVAQPTEEGFVSGLVASSGNPWELGRMWKAAVMA